MLENQDEVAEIELYKAPILFEHVERYLGPVNASWMETLEVGKSPFQAVRCAGRVPAVD